MSELTVSVLPTLWMKSSGPPDVMRPRAAAEAGSPIMRVKASEPNSRPPLATVKVSTPGPAKVIVRAALNPFQVRELIVAPPLGTT